MDTKLYSVGDIQIQIDSDAKNVMPPSPYSLFLARHIPSLQGAIVADVGTGCGIQAIVAKLRGATTVFLLDNNPAAISMALSNAKKNHVTELIPLPPGDVLAPLPANARLNTIICNPASLPMRTSDSFNSPYYAGPDGRRMIERLICQSESRLVRGGQLYMVHSSIADFKVSKELLASLNFDCEVTATERLEFRPFYDQEWIDTLGGTTRGLYDILSGHPSETLYLVVATKRLYRRSQVKKSRRQKFQRANSTNYERIANEN
jgi:release factor glutamine methyltransferase